MSFFTESAAAASRQLRTDFRVAAAASTADAEKCGWFQNLQNLLLAGLAAYSTSNFLGTGYTAKEMFDIADVNSDGQVSLSEFNQVLDQLQPGTALNNDQWKGLTNYKYYLTQKDFERQPERNAEGRVVRPDPTDHYWELTRKEPRKLFSAGRYMTEDKAMIEHEAYMDWSRTEVSLINHVLKYRIAREFYEAWKAEPEKATEDLIKDVLDKLKKQRVQRIKLLESRRFARTPEYDAKYAQLRNMYNQGLSSVGLPEEYVALPVIVPWMLGLFVLFFLQHILPGEGDKALAKARREYEDKAIRVIRMRDEALRARDEALRARHVVEAGTRRIAEEVYRQGINRVRNAWTFVETQTKDLVRRTNAAAFAQLEIAIGDNVASGGSENAEESFEQAKEKADQEVVTCPICLKPFSDAAVPGVVFEDGAIAMNKLMMRHCGHILCKDCARRNQAMGRTTCPVGCNTEPLFKLDDDLYR